MGPMPEDNIEVDVLWKFSTDDYHKIEMGYVPNDFPGDRYFMFMEENTFYIGTSSGNCLYRIWLRKSGSEYEAYKVQMAKNPYFEREKQIKRDLGTIQMILHDTLRVSK